jgi:hypothetical protein
MEEIINIIIKVVAMLLAMGAGYLGRYIVKVLKANLDEKKDAMLDLFIEELVAAAEQMFKKNDPDGVIRLEYVEDSLIDAGYEITEAVRALIESKVFSLNLINPKGGDVR